MKQYHITYKEVVGKKVSALSVSGVKSKYFELFV